MSRRYFAVSLAISFVGLLICSDILRAANAPTASVPAAAKHNTLSDKELADGWILLFDGETTYGWQPQTDANWKVDGGVLSASEGKGGMLLTTSEFGDYELHAEFRAEKKTNSGIFLHTAATPTDPAVDCYELNIAAEDVSPFYTGSFVKRKKATVATPTGDWQTFHVQNQFGKFTVQVDGKTVLEYTDEKPLGRGPIGLQFREGKIEFRNLKLKPLSTKSLFNGKDLSGWTVFPDKASKFTVTAAGELNVKDGPGALTTEAKFADFTLQFEVFSNGKHLNSGVFFRSIPGDFNNGYECQIQNGYKDGDRTMPIDCGTGGFYRRQNARRVVSDDFKWTPITLIATGDHMAAWVNGIQVSDWTDTRKPDANPRKGLRREAGTLILQGHDPTTDLSFRNIRAVELPARKVAEKTTEN